MYMYLNDWVISYYLHRMYRIKIDDTELSKGCVSYFFSTSHFQIWSFHCLDWAGDSNDAEEQPGPRVQELKVET